MLRPYNIPLLNQLKYLESSSCLFVSDVRNLEYYKKENVRLPSQGKHTIYLSPILA